MKIIDLRSENLSPLHLMSRLKSEIEQGRKPLLFFFVDWMPPCVSFMDALNDDRLKNALSDVTLLILEPGAPGAGDALAKKFSVWEMPVFIHIDAEINEIKRITGAAWGADTVENMAPVMKQFMAS